MVRRSESRPDSFALSLKVPIIISQSIVHYLIISSNSGGGGIKAWRIKVNTADRSNSPIAFLLTIRIFLLQGSCKTFSSLFSLVVHHSVMSELLPCTLLLAQQQRFDHSDDDDDLSDYPDLLFTLRKAFGSTANLAAAHSPSSSSSSSAGTMSLSSAASLE